MRSIILRLMLLLAAFAMVPDTFAADGGGIFLDAKDGSIIGKPLGGISASSSGSSWGADGGYLWNLDGQSSLGLELGYMHFGEIGDDSGNFGSNRLSANATSLGAHFQYLFGDERGWIFQARGGFTSVAVHDDFTSFFSPNSSTTSDKSGLYLGFGIGHRIVQGFSVILAYNHYATIDKVIGDTDLQLDWIGLVAQYQF